MIMLAMNWPISFEQPVWLWLLAAIPLVVVFSWRAMRALEGYRKWTAVVLRGLVIAALALALARVEWVRHNDRVAVMFVMDRSKSIPDELRKATQNYIRTLAKEADPRDRLGVIGFDGEADVDLMPSRGGFEVLDFGSEQQPDRTDIAAGLRLAMAAFPDGYARRVVILTDGNQNVGDLSEEIEAAKANHVSVDVVPLQYQYQNEILFDRINVPAHADRDTKVPVRLIVKSQRPGQAKLSLYHNDQEVPLADPVLTLTGGMRPDPFTIPIELHGGGIHRFDARLTPIPDNADSIEPNNKATAFTFVEDRGRVLILTQTGLNDDKVLYDALQREKVDVEMRSVDQVPIDLLNLQEFGVVILANISADTFNEEQHKALASYVRDFGGGLVMIGGNEGLGAGGWIGRPIEEVSPVWFEVKHKKIIPKGALAIVMHSCEIPRGNYWGEQVAIAAVKTVSSLDYVGVVCYSFDGRGVNWDVPLAPAGDKQAVLQRVKQMQIGDMPDFDTSLILAVSGLMGDAKDASQRHIIIISDGDPSPPSAATLQQMRDAQITCSTVGIGYGSHVVEPTLKDIARKTGGRFYACKTASQLPQIFVKESKVVKRALIQEEMFQPHMDVPFAQTVTGIGANEMPQLGGLVLSTPKGDALVPIVRNSEDGPDPVLAHWNYELGKMAVFTSGWWPKWGSDWAAWEKFGKFWAQLVRWAMRPEGSADFDIVTRVEGNKGVIAIEALNKDASYLNFLNIGGRVLTPSMEQQPIYFEQVGPGQYEGRFDVKDHGNYLASLRYNDGQKGVGMVQTGVSVSYSPEFRELRTNMSLLEQAAERTGGRVLAMQPDVKQVFDRRLPPSVSRQPVWRWVIQWLLLPLFLLDVAMRRLASWLAISIYVEAAVLVMMCAILYAVRAPAWAYVGALVLAEAMGWAMRWAYVGPFLQFVTGGLTAHVGQESARSLSQLKGVREKVREEMTAKSDRTTPLEGSADPKRRFEVDESAAPTEAIDLSEAMGGASLKPIDSEPTSQPAADQRAADDVTSRLLRAKRRAQKEMQDRGDQSEK